MFLIAKRIDTQNIVFPVFSMINQIDFHSNRNILIVCSSRFVTCTSSKFTFNFNCSTFISEHLYHSIPFPNQTEK